MSTNITWEEKKLEILIRDGHECRACHVSSVACSQSKGKLKLLLHFLRPGLGKYPWEYDNNDLIILCTKCYDKAYKARHRKNKKSFQPKAKIFYGYNTTK